MKKYETTLEVRDYECDIQGIVNNANYLHYLEHTRHMFLKTLGLSFRELHEQGTDVVVARMSLQYKAPLRGGDEFRSVLGMTKEGLRYVFHQDILNTNGRLCLRAKVEVVCIVDGRLSDSERLQQAFAEYLT